MRFLIFFIVVLAKIFASAEPNACSPLSSNGESDSYLSLASDQSPSPARLSRDAAADCTPPRDQKISDRIKGVKVSTIKVSRDMNETIQFFVEIVNKLFKRSGQNPDSGFDIVDSKILKDIIALNNLPQKTQAQMPCVFSFLPEGTTEETVYLTIKLPIPELEDQSPASPFAGQKQKMLTRRKNAQIGLEDARSFFPDPETVARAVSYDPQQFFSAFVTDDKERLHTLEGQTFKTPHRLKVKVRDKAEKTVALAAELSECERKTVELDQAIDKENEQRSLARTLRKRQFMQPYMHEIDDLLTIDERFTIICARVLPFSHTERQALSACLFSRDPSITKGTLFCYTRAKPCNHAEGSDNQGIPCVNIYNMLGEIFRNVELYVFFKDEIHHGSFSVEQVHRISRFISPFREFLEHPLQGKLAQQGIRNIESLITNLLDPALDDICRAEQSDVLFSHLQRAAPDHIRSGFYNSIYGIRNVRYIRI